jgi:hypothetical protein
MKKNKAAIMTLPAIAPMTIPAIAPPDRDDPDEDALLPVVAAASVDVGVDEEVVVAVVVVVVVAGELEEAATVVGAEPSVTVEL